MKRATERPKGFAVSQAPLDGADLCLGQCGIAILGTSMRFVSIASLALHVQKVLCLSPKEQMRRVATDWIVATVKYAQAAWNWSMRELPRYAVGSFDAASVRAYLAVAVRAQRGSPQPTTVGFANFRPEPLFNWRLAHKRNSNTLSSE